MSHFGRASALLLLLSIPVSWVVVRLSGIENSPQVNITYDRYFIFFILLFLLAGFVLACIALYRKERPRFVSKVSFAVALCALLFLGWQLASRMINNSKNSGTTSDAIDANPDSSGGAISSDESRNTSDIDSLEVTDENRSVLSSTHASVVTVSDWGSGFNTTFECQLPGSGAVHNFLITFDYSGNATLTNAWMLKYDGGVDVRNITADGEYGIRSVGHLPPLKAGEKLSFVVQGSGSGFSTEDFDIRCTR